MEHSLSRAFLVGPFGSGELHGAARVGSPCKPLVAGAFVVGRERIDIAHVGRVFYFLLSACCHELDILHLRCDLGVCFVSKLSEIEFLLSAVRCGDDESEGSLVLRIGIDFQFNAFFIDSPRISFICADELGLNVCLCHLCIGDGVFECALPGQVIDLAALENGDYSGETILTFTGLAVRVECDRRLGKGDSGSRIYI